MQTELLTNAWLSLVLFFSLSLCIVSLISITQVLLSILSLFLLKLYKVNYWIFSISVTESLMETRGQKKIKLQANSSRTKVESNNYCNTCSISLKVPNVKFNFDCLLSIHLSKSNLTLGTHLHAMIRTHHFDLDIGFWPISTLMLKTLQQSRIPPWVLSVIFAYDLTVKP